MKKTRTDLAGVAPGRRRYGRRRALSEAGCHRGHVLSVARRFGRQLTSRHISEPPREQPDVAPLAHPRLRELSRRGKHRREVTVRRSRQRSDRHSEAGDSICHTDDPRKHRD